MRIHINYFYIDQISHVKSLYHKYCLCMDICFWKFEILEKKIYLRGIVLPEGSIIMQGHTHLALEVESCGCTRRH